MQSDSSTTPLYVGIDIGKNVHCYGVCRQVIITNRWDRL
jgi:hypothetical protein